MAETCVLTKGVYQDSELGAVRGDHMMYFGWECWPSDSGCASLCTPGCHESANGIFWPRVPYCCVGWRFCNRTENSAASSFPKCGQPRVDCRSRGPGSSLTCRLNHTVPPKWLPLHAKYTNRLTYISTRACTYADMRTCIQDDQNPAWPSLHTGVGV